MDLLFGLDMLKAHQACIDLEKNVLRIQGREVEFLSEHELPSKARDGIVLEDNGSQITGAGPSRPPASSFPGAGSTLSSPPRGNIPAANSTLPPPELTRQSRWPEKDIKALIDLGVTRDVAIQTLNAANGNVDVAASLLF